MASQSMLQYEEKILKFFYINPFLILDFKANKRFRTQINITDKCHGNNQVNSIMIKAIIIAKSLWKIQK